MSHRTVLCRGITPTILVVGLISFAFLCAACAGADEKRPSSYAPVVIPVDFEKTMARMDAVKLQVNERQAALLLERYDLSDQPAKEVTMSCGKPVQSGVPFKIVTQKVDGRNLLSCLCTLAAYTDRKGRVDVQSTATLQRIDRMTI